LIVSFFRTRSKLRYLALHLQRNDYPFLKDSSKKARTT
jgi:hypothetical protein